MIDSRIIMVRSLDKKWKELLFAFSGFGPNFLMVMMGAYFTNAVNPANLPEGSLKAFGTFCLISPLLFPILYAIAKAFDGIIDIPFAHITDSLRTKWGKRRPAIAICFIPMVISFAFCWWPVAGISGSESSQIINTIWIIFWAFIFFSTYTMCLISFYGSLSSTCTDEPQRTRVSAFKSFFDTISYCIVYALVPLFLDATKLHIDKFTLICLPLMFTMIIPLFLIKEGEKYGFPERSTSKASKISIWQSLKLTFKNRIFVSWLIVNCCTFFGLQMFLSSMGPLIETGLGFNGTQTAIINTCAFAPVPVMLYLFNKLKRAKGVRFTYQTCLLAFAVAILGFFFSSTFILGTDNVTLQFIISCTTSVIGSWAIGAFFMMPYLAASQISSVEEKITGRNHSAMYFAGNAVVTSIVGAISSILIYENIKMLFIDKNTGSVIYAESFDKAKEALGSSASVFNLGIILVPFIVAIACILGFLVAFKMPKDFSSKDIALEFKRHNPSLDISNVVSEEEANKEETRVSSLFVNIALVILSGFIFGFIWLGFLIKGIKRLLKIESISNYLLCCLIPFYGIYFSMKTNNLLKELGQKNGLKINKHRALHIISGILFVFLPLNVVSLSINQHLINKMFKIEIE